MSIHTSRRFQVGNIFSSHFIHPLHLEQAVAFYYYGIPRCCGGYYAICVDCDPNNPIFTHIDAVNTSDDGQNPPV